MTLIERLDDWRHTLIQGRAQDGEEPPTEEEVLAMFLYSSIDACFMTDGMVEMFLNAGQQNLPERFDFDNALNAWIDTYAAEN